MCGIVGFIGHPLADLGERVDAMLRAQRHRGPDGEGRWREVVGGAEVGLGHGRLAIIDLSDAGRQPMVSESGSHVLVFNGEIYNYRELREELRAEGVRFHTGSDTEVLLQLLVHRGVEALSRCNGMWAFALVDVAGKRLLLARDRFGVKPLYHCRRAEGVYFASEIKSILEGSRARFRPNASVVGRYLTQSILDADCATFFEGIESFPAGSYAWIDLDDPERTISPRRFWSMPTLDRFPGDEPSRIAQLHDIFSDAVGIRLRSDVPVGVLLSGGLDSASIAAMMQRTLGPSADLHLLSAVSDDPRFDESPFVDRVARHLRARVHKVKLGTDPLEQLRLLDEVTRHNDEPVLSFSYVAHYQLMREARAQGLKVILSGQGADEILCGYRKYLGFQLQALVRERRLREAASTLAGFVRRRTIVTQLRFAEAKRYLPTFLVGRGHPILGPRVAAAHRPLALGLADGTLIERQRADVEKFSVPALVHYEDRMSMAFGCEIRLPFLDYRLVSAVLPAASRFKLRDGWTKWLLRQAMEPHLPKEIVWRKDKKGFSTPGEVWMAGQLRPSVRKVFSDGLVTERLGLLAGAGVRARYEAFSAQSDPAAGRIGFRDVFAPLALETWARQFEAHLA